MDGGCMGWNEGLPPVRVLPASTRGDTHPLSTHPEWSPQETPFPSSLPSGFPSGLFLSNAQLQPVTVQGVFSDRTELEEKTREIDQGGCPPLLSPAGAQ